jgi:4-carboxymuconolactone decarboxylase
MTRFSSPPLGSPLDVPTRALVVLAAQAAGGDETGIRAAVAAALAECPKQWVEELVLQTYLFAGFPRALNTAREWRRSSGPAARAASDSVADADPEANARDWKARGEATCAVVYGDAYARLRTNIAALHPALDTWMIVEGYGKVLSRPGLDLPRRELCVIAACAHTRQDRQLHSHLHGALNAGAPAESVSATLDALEGVVEAGALHSARLLWSRVRAQH